MIEGEEFERTRRAMQKARELINVTRNEAQKLVLIRYRIDLLRKGPQGVRLIEENDKYANE